MCLLADILICVFLNHDRYFGLLPTTVPVRSLPAAVQSPGTHSSEARGTRRPRRALRNDPIKPAARGGEERLGLQLLSRLDRWAHTDRSSGQRREGGMKSQRCPVQGASRPQWFRLRGTCKPRSPQGNQLSECTVGPVQGTERNGKPALTSAGMLATAGAIPFSVLTFPELLLGELGAEPGALLQAESVGRRDTGEPRCAQRLWARPRHVLTGPGAQGLLGALAFRLLTGTCHIMKQHDRGPQTGTVRLSPYFQFCY